MSERTQAVDDEIIAMYLDPAQVPVAQICGELGIYPARVYMALSRNGVPRRSDVPGGLRRGAQVSAPGLVLSDETLQRVAVEYMLKQKTAKEIAADLDMPYSKVLRILGDAKVQIVPGRRGRKQQALRTKVQKDLLDGGIEMAEIAVKWGVPLEFVRKVASNLSEFKKVFQDTKWGEKEALVEEVLHRLKEDFAQEVGEKQYQLKLPGM